MKYAAMSTRPAHALRICMLLWALMAGVAWPVSAQNLRGFENSPLALFTQEDRDLMTKNVNEVLEAEAPDASQNWVNPKSGNSGSVSVRSKFTATDGASCKRLRIVNKVKKGSVESDTMQIMCKYEGRGWLLHPDAVPAS